MQEQERYKNYVGKTNDTDKRYCEHCSPQLNVETITCTVYVHLQDLKYVISTDHDLLTRQVTSRKTILLSFVGQQ